MHGITFSGGDSGDSGDNIHNPLKGRALRVSGLVPTAGNGTGDTGDKIGFCPRLSPVQNSDRGQTSKATTAAKSTHWEIVSPVSPVSPQKKRWGSR